MEIKEKETDAKEIEEFLKTAESQKGKKPKKSRAPIGPAIKRFLPAVVVVVIALILFASIMSQGSKIAALEKETATLKAKLSANEIGQLKSQIAALDTRVEKLVRERDQLSQELAGINQKIEGLKAQKAKAEVKKPAADKKKPPRKQ